MGFVHDFSPKPAGRTPEPPPQVARRPPGKRGFFADFNPRGAELAEQDVYRPAPPGEVSYSSEPVMKGAPITSSTPDLDLTTYSRPASSTFVRRGSSVSRPTTSRPTTSQPPPSQPTTFPAVAPDPTPAGPAPDVRGVESELRGLAQRVRALDNAGRGTESKVSELEQEIAHTRQSLSEAKQTVSDKQRRYQQKETALERDKRAIGRMEMRLSGLDSGGWGGSGGGSWSSSPSDEYLFSRDELRSIDSASQRKSQMALVLERRRDKVWRTQDEVSNARTAVMNAETRVRELETKLNTLSSQLEQARQSKQQVQGEKAAAESKLAQLKDRYHGLTGQFW